MGSHDALTFGKRQQVIAIARLLQGACLERSTRSDEPGKAALRRGQ